MPEVSACSLGPVPRPVLDSKAKLQAFKHQSLGVESPLRCSGTVTIGVFFDGTGNNEKDDYDGGKVPGNLQKHSNIVKLFEVHSADRNSRDMTGTSGYYKYYIPGVGTPFPEIGDEGGALGGGFGAVGEQRIIWALIQVLELR